MKLKKNAGSWVKTKILKSEFKGFSKGEEIFNAVSHIVGGTFAIAVTVIGIIFATIHNDSWAIVAMAIYGASMILVYTSSSIYHFLRRNRAKKVFRILDHCMIFLLIAGTYTPYCLIALRGEGGWGWGIFTAQWVVTILGITFKAINMHDRRVKVFSMTAYLVMGWLGVIAFVPLMNTLALAGILWTVAGGVAYTVGAIFYACGKRKKYIHSVWHLFVVLGSVLQFIAILFYVVMQIQ